MYVGLWGVGFVFGAGGCAPGSFSNIGKHGFRNTSNRDRARTAYRIPKGRHEGVLEGKRVSKCAHTRRGGVDSSNANSRLGPVVFIHTWLVLGQHPSRAEECFSDL